MCKTQILIVSLFTTHTSIKLWPHINIITQYTAGSLSRGSSHHQKGHPSNANQPVQKELHIVETIRGKLDDYQVISLWHNSHIMFVLS